MRGLVFGAWGEASPDVERLLSMIVRKGATNMWRTLGCNDEDAARGLLAWMLRRRRRRSLTALRENAQLKLERLAFVGHGAAAAAQRRVQANTLHMARAALQLPDDGSGGNSSHFEVAFLVGCGDVSRDRRLARGCFSCVRLV